MPYTKTTWVEGGAPGVSAENLNKIEQGVADAHALNVDNVTLSDTTAPTADTAAPKTLLNWIANMIRSTTGKANWRTAPRTTLENAVKLNGDTMTGPLILSGDPSAALGAATRQYADTKVAKSGDTITGRTEIATAGDSAQLKLTRTGTSAPGSVYLGVASSLLRVYDSTLANVMLEVDTATAKIITKQNILDDGSGTGTFVGLKVGANPVYHAGNRDAGAKIIPLYSPGTFVSTNSAALTPSVAHQTGAVINLLDYRFLWEAAFATSRSIYFEALFKVNSGTGIVALRDSGGGAIQLSTTSTTTARVRSGAIGLGAGEFHVEMSGAGTVYLYEARLVIV